MAKATEKWDEFCINLRKRLFQAEEFQTKIPVEEIHRQSGTTVLLTDLRKPGYWNASRDGKRDWDNAQKFGIELDFDVAPDGNVHAVTFSLDESRRGTLERFIDKRMGR